MELKIEHDVILYELFKLRLEFINNYTFFRNFFLSDLTNLCKSKMDPFIDSITRGFLLKLGSNLTSDFTYLIEMKLNLFQTVLYVIKIGIIGLKEGESTQVILFTLLQCVEFMTLYVRLKIVYEFSCDLRLVKYENDNLYCFIDNSIGGKFLFGKVELGYIKYDTTDYLEEMYKKSVTKVNICKKTPIYKGPEVYLGPPVLEYNKMVKLFYNK